MNFQIFRDVQNQWRWRLRAANNRIIATSGEGYFNRVDCINAIHLVKGAATAPIYE